MDNRLRKAFAVFAGALLFVGLTCGAALAAKADRGGPQKSDNSVRWYG